MLLRTSWVAAVAAVLIAFAIQDTSAASTRQIASFAPHSRFFGRLAQLPAFMTPAASNPSTPVLFVSDQESNAVYLFNANDFDLPPLGKITSGINTPAGIAVDPHGLLYVANADGVKVYKPGALQPFRTIHAAAGSPYAIAISRDGTVAIAWEPAAFLFTPATLVVFDRGSLTATRTISIGLDGMDLVGINGVAIDGADTIYLSVHRYPARSGMVKFLAGSTQAVSVNIPIGFGMGFDAAGDLYISYGGGIAVFPPRSTTVARSIRQGLAAAMLIAVTPDGHIFAPNVEHFDYGLNQDVPGNLVEFAPGGSSPIEELTSAQIVDPRGVAIRPAF